MYLYKTKGDRIELFLDFLKNRMFADTLCFFLDSKSIGIVQNLHEYLGGKDKRGELEFVALEELYLKRKIGDPNYFASLLEEILKKGETNGNTGLSVLADIGFILQLLPKTKVVEIEQVFHDFFSNNPARGICIYFYESLPGDLLEELNPLHLNVYFSSSLIENLKATDKPEEKVTFPEVPISLDQEIAKLLLLHPRRWEILKNGSIPHIYPREIMNEPQSLDEILWILDSSYRFRYISPSVYSFTGKPESYFLGQSLEEVFAPEIYLKNKGAFEHLKPSPSNRENDEGGSGDTLNVRVEIPLKTGKLIPTESKVSKVFWGNILLGYLGITRPLKEIEWKEKKSSSYSSNGITAREHEIITCLLSGMQNKEIADRLFLAEITIKKHLSNIYKKLKVKNRFELLRALRESEY